MLIKFIQMHSASDPHNHGMTILYALDNLGRVWVYQEGWKEVELPEELIH